MAKTSTTTPVKGGSITRDASSGRVMEVRTAKGASKATEKTRFVLKEVSATRTAALKRLADR